MIEEPIFSVSTLVQKLTQNLEMMGSNATVTLWPFRPYTKSQNV